MQKPSRFIRLFRLATKIRSEQLKVSRSLAKKDGNPVTLIKRFDTLQKRKEKIESLYKSL